MKTRIILSLATVAALALPAVAEEGNRFRDRDGNQRTNVVQTYRYDNDSFRRNYDTDDFRRYDRDDYWRREAQEQRERREQVERFREHREHDGDRR
jgi:hypothetical protein